MIIKKPGDRKIPSDSVGDIVLYAKIRTNKWTDLY